MQLLSFFELCGVAVSFENLTPRPTYLRFVLRFNRIKIGVKFLIRRLSPVIHHIPLQSETAASKCPKPCVQCIATSISRPFFILRYAYRSSRVYLPVVELRAVTFPCRVL